MKIYLILLTVLLGCQSRSIKNDLSTIKILDKSSNKIQINDDDTTYGPIAKTFEDNNEESKVELPVKVFGINLTPLLYNSFLYVPVLKKLNKQNVNVHVIGGYGFSAVIASLFANSKNINDFEWKIFKLYKKIEGYPSFSGKWQREIRSFLKDEFKDKKVYELSKLLLIPRVKGREVIYRLKSKVVNEVMFSLTSRLRANYFANPRGDIVRSFNKNSSCDICKNLAFKVNKLNIVDNNGDKLQIYSKILGQVQSNPDYYLIENIESSIDRLYGLEICYSRYDNSIEKVVNNLKINSADL